MGINLFALHYFLWFAAISAIYGYVSVYAAHYANASTSQYGLLNMILPFVTIGSKLIFCSLADRHRAHRTYFIIFLITTLIGYGSFAVLPFFVKPQPNEAGLNKPVFAIICLMTSVGTISMSVISCLSDAFAVNSARTFQTNYGMIRLWGTIGWGISALLLAFLNQDTSWPFLVPGLLMLIVLIAIDILAASLWCNSEDFDLNESASGVNIDDIVTILGPRNAQQTQEQQNRTADLEAQAEGAQDQQQQQQQCRGSYGSTTNGHVYYSPTKSVPVRMNVDENGQEHHDKAKKASNDQLFADMTMTTTTSLIDITSVRMQWILFKEVATRRRSIFRYMILFTISGALISLQWSYFFLYLNQIYTQDFTYISGLSMVGQSMLGELPFFLISQWVIKLLGRSHTLSISIASLGGRYLLYEYLLPNSSMYFVLFTETFQGPSFGLFYVVMTEVGLDYSDCEEAIVSTVERGLVANDPKQIDKLRQALRATTQSLMSACYEGLGVGLGSILGGLAIEYYGFSNLWFYSSLLALLLGLLNYVIDITGLPILADKQSRMSGLQKQ